MKEIDRNRFEVTELEEGAAIDANDVAEINHLLGTSFSAKVSTTSEDIKGMLHRDAVICVVRDRAKNRGIVGIASLSVLDELPAVRGWVSYVCTHKDYVRKGIAAAAMRYIEQAAQARGYEEILLGCREYNEAGNALYEELGYERRTGHFYRCELR